MKILDHDNVLSLLPDRDPWSHKGNYGRILLLCGSEGFTGAAFFAAMGALRSGAGLVYVGVPRSVYPIVAVKLNEAIVFPLPDKNGMLSGDCLSVLSQRLINMDAVLIGPGLGVSEGTLDVTRFVLENYTGPVVLDADGINVLQKHKDILRSRPYPTVLTPHDGEFSRLGGNLDTERIQETQRIASDLGCIMVRKGHETVITDAKCVYLNKTGNPGMATGGSGDVLAGIITSLIGQKLPIPEAVACGVWLHGAAGDMCRDTIGEYGMLPTDMLEALPRLMK